MLADEARRTPDRALKIGREEEALLLRMSSWRERCPSWACPGAART